VSTGIFIQVRLGSTRLPHKAILPLPGGNVIQHVMRALGAVPAEVHALLTDAASADALFPFAKAEGYEVFPGPDEDVLARYCMACREYRVTRVVRATGDNPLTSAALAREILSIHAAHGADLSHFIGCPWGAGVEVVQAESLFAAERDAEAQEEREHITTFLYRNRMRFSIIEPQAPMGSFCPDARVTVDTREDYERVKTIFKTLYKGAPIEVEEIVAWLNGRQGEARDD
jgi:spore coat polysaccharide biosynthesis protein SpsF